ncbi:hypothetical protein GQ607_002378 [Colletotrichum asianum]|uniref:BRCT domain-containing protein n=1 Tax=Colletotrichum asianum TaxID=702518 RepID=A0A8H3WP73_9PEZI|nr:hypothetical protein GQ607_002378 [Colletotrichum asianum]
MSLEGCYVSFAGKHPQFNQDKLQAKAKKLKATHIQDKEFTEEFITNVGAKNVHLLAPDVSAIANTQKFAIAKQSRIHILHTDWLLDCERKGIKLGRAAYTHLDKETIVPDGEVDESHKEREGEETHARENTEERHSEQTQTPENDQDVDNNQDADTDAANDQRRVEKGRQEQEKAERKRKKAEENKRKEEEKAKDEKKRKGEEVTKMKKKGEKNKKYADNESSEETQDREQTRDRSMTLVAEDTGSDVEDPQQRSKKQAGKSRKSENQGSASTTKDAIRRNGLSKVKPMPVSADDSEDHSDGGDRSEDADDQSDDDEQIGNDQFEDGDNGLDMIKDEESQSDNENDMIYDEDANSSQDEYDARARSSSTGRSRSSRASSSRAEREGSHLGPTPPPDVVISQVDKLELVRDPDDKTRKSNPVKSRILFMWGKTYLVVALPGKNPRYPKQERAYLILASLYKRQADAYRNAGGRVLETFDKFNLEGLEVEDMVINIVASTPDDSKSVILARQRDEDMRNSKKTKKNVWLLYSRTTFNQAFRGRAGDHTINTRRIKTGQPALAQTRRERGTPDKYLRIQGI